MASRVRKQLRIVINQRKRSSATVPPVVAGDVTPAPMTFGDVTYDGDFQEYGYRNKQVTGIDQTITLRMEIANGAGATLYYLVSNSNNGFEGLTSATSPSGYGMTAIANNGTFTVSNNQWVSFGMVSGCTQGPTVTVKNQSDSNATLGSFQMLFFGECI